MPSKEDVGAMGGWELPENAQRPPMIALQSIFHGEVPPEAIDLVKNLLLYNPQKRLNARQAREHIFFDEFRTRVNNGKDLFSIVGFNAVEIF